MEKSLRPFNSPSCDTVSQHPTRTPKPVGSLAGYAPTKEDLPGCQATAAPGENGGARCGSQRPSCVGGSGAGHVVAVARPVMSPGAQPS